MVRKQLRVLRPILVTLFCFFYVACSSSGSQNQATEDQPTAMVNSPSSPLDGKGAARVIPNDPVAVNTYGTWEVVYSVGKGGIAAGGGIAVHISPYWGWTQPQNKNPDYPGYTTVSTSNQKAALDIVIGSPHYIVVRTKDTPLTLNDTITITYGDTGGGKHPAGRARCDRYAEEGEEFFIKVDGDGDGHFYPIADQPRITILNGHADALVITAPSIVEQDTTFTVTVAAVDPADNWARNYRGTVDLSSSSPEAIIPPKHQFQNADRGTTRVDALIRKAGIYFITAEDKKNGFKERSNPILCVDKPLSRHLYWGDIHGHSGLCDGTGTPDNYYQYARDVAGLDISALTTHDAHGFLPLDEDEETWTLIRERTDFYYRPGDFVTFLGYEWTNWTYGHQHVIFLNSEEGRVCSFRDPKSSDPKGLWECLKGKKAFTIPHHVGGGPVPTDWNFYDPSFQPLTEICSIHGNCEYYGALKGIYSPQEGHFVQDALARGYKLGIIASGDSHNAHPGRRDPGALTAGLMGVYAEELTRESICKALQERSFYATTGPRILIDFSVNSNTMGQSVRIDNEHSARSITGSVIGTDMIREVTVIKNGSDLFVEKGSGREKTINYSDTTPVKAGDYYYLRVVQEDDEIAWSSPIWFEVDKTKKSE
jgi:hypothetical protein